MATRNERVVLTLDDQFSSKMAKAAAATALFKRQLNDLDGTQLDAGASAEKASKGIKAYTLEMAVAEERSRRLKKELRDQARAQLDASDGIEKVGDSASKSGREIDRLSGRLRLLTDIALVGGPALIPLGASTIPVLTGALAGLGAAAGGIGTAVLAFQGIGDAVKSLSEYRLQPTAENLAKVRAEMEKVGPAGSEFARFIANLEPELRALQNTARGHFFPGLQDGITSLLERAPEVEKIANRISKALGDLSRDAGASLAGENFNAFFDYLKSEAAPTLESFGRSIGNITLGLANMLVAFAPVTRDFTGGLEDMTRAFAEWSANLDTNEGFQNFVGYIRESGPQAIEFLGAIAGALSGLIQAAAPMGQVVLPALTALSNVFAAISSSPIGPGLYTAVAAFVAFRRGADLTSAALDRFNVSSETTRTSLTKFGGLAAGIVGTAAAVGALADNINRINPSNLDRSLTALGLGTVTDDVEKVIDSLVELDSKRNAVDLGEIVTLGGLAGDSSLDKFANNIDLVDQRLASLVETGNSAQAKALYDSLVGLAEGRGLDAGAVADRFDAYNLALQNIADEQARAKGIASLFGAAIGDVGGAAGAAATKIDDLSGSLGRLQGFFDKRGAIRNYKDAIDQLAAGIKDGFTREDAANLDAVGESIIQVANQIKNPDAKATFLKNARQSLLDLAPAGSDARKAIREVTDKMVELGLIKAEPKITADDRRAAQAAQKVKTEWGYLDQLTSKPKVEADPGNSFSILGAIKARMDAIQSKTVTVTVNQRGGVTSSLGGRSDGPAAADGGTVPKSGLPYADRYHYLLADGEEVISNRFGQADRHRDLLKAINANRLADGGTTGRRRDRDGFHVAATFPGLLTELNALEKALKKSTNALEAETSERDRVRAAMDSLASSVSSKFDVDLGERGNAWSGGNGLATTISKATMQADALPAIIAALQGAGLSEAALEEVLREMDFTQLQALAANPGQTAELGAALSRLYAAQGAAGSAAGSAVYGSELFARDATVEALTAEVKKLREDVKSAQRSASKDADRNAGFVASSVNGAAVNGIRRGRGRR